jgi:hypothetical protein
MNNRGTVEIGPNFLLGRVYANGLLGQRDKLGLIRSRAPTSSASAGRRSSPRWRTASDIFRR